MKQDNNDDYIRMAELTAVYLPCTSRLPNFPQGLCITFVIKIYSTVRQARLYVVKKILHYSTPLGHRRYCVGRDQ